MPIKGGFLPLGLPGINRGDSVGPGWAESEAGPHLWEPAIDRDLCLVLVENNDPGCILPSVL